jgi:hypothetical protein
MEMKAVKFEVFSLIFRYEILYARYVNLLDKLKEVKKFPFFRLWSVYAHNVKFDLSSRNYRRIFSTDFEYDPLHIDP